MDKCKPKRKFPQNHKVFARRKKEIRKLQLLLKNNVRREELPTKLKETSFSKESKNMNLIIRTQLLPKPKLEDKPNFLDKSMFLLKLKLPSSSGSEVLTN